MVGLRGIFFFVGGREELNVSIPTRTNTNMTKLLVTINRKQLSGDKPIGPKFVKAMLWDILTFKLELRIDNTHNTHRKPLLVKIMAAVISNIIENEYGTWQNYGLFEAQTFIFITK